MNLMLEKGFLWGNKWRGCFNEYTPQMKVIIVFEEAFINGFCVLLKFLLTKDI